MKRILFIIILMTFLLSTENEAMCQQYYVSNTYDTIPGKFLFDRSRDYSEEIEFRNPYNNRVKLTPNNAIFIYYSDKTQYRSVPFMGERYFMEIIYEGSLTIYFYQRVHIETGVGSLSYVLLKNNGDSMRVSASDFESKMIDFLADCPDLQAKVIDKKYKYRDMKKIGIAYEACDSNIKKNSKKASSDFDSFRSGVDQSQKNLNKSDIKGLLDDIQKRHNNNEEIPDFLWSSLIALVDADKELKEKAVVLKNQIGN